MGNQGTALLPPREKIYTGHRPCPPPVDGPCQEHKCLSDAVVPRTAGL